MVDTSLSRTYNMKGYIYVKNRRKFTLDYKVEAAHRVIDTGRTSTEVAQELSINEASLRAWVRGKKTN